VKSREVLLLEAARFEQHHRECVAKREHHRRARSRRQVHRTRLLLDVHIEEHLTILRQRRPRIAAHGDDPDLKPGERRQDAEQFLRLTAGAQREHHIAVRHHAEVAVQRVEGVQNDCRRAGARQRRRDLLADLTGLADPEHDHLSARLYSLLDQLHRARKLLAQAVPQPLELENFHLEHAFALFKILHRPVTLRLGIRRGKVCVVPVGVVRI
jgi:hypothetical protein